MTVAPPLSHRPHLTLAAGRTWLAACAVAALATATCARAGDDLPLRLRHPSAIRLGAAVFLPTTTLGGPEDLYESVTFSRQLLEPLALELSVGGGGDGNRNGLHLGAAARVWAVGGEHAGLTAALGARMAFLREYGAVGFAHLEAAYELRLESGFNVVAGGGYAMPLNTSRRDPRRCDGEFLVVCRDRFVGGAPGLFLEGQVGWSF